MSSYKIVLIGNFKEEYESTLGVEVHGLTFETNHGQVGLNVWDCSGKEENSGLRDGYYLKSQGVIFFSDFSTKRYPDMRFLKEYIKKNPSSPMVIVRSKNDLINSVSYDKISFYLGRQTGMLIKEYPTQRKHPFYYKEISTKTGQNLADLNLAILRSVTGLRDLEIKS
jgi:GTP-binding nuclear protein Ran